MWRSTVARSQKICLKVNCSAMKRARLPVR
ncbi:Uncharacterised protein [Vibrio cholerae]|nr:Uncharacterised protein [Vibrio cholerae]